MRKIFQRIFAVVPAVLLQFAWMFLLLRWLAPYAAVLNFILTLLALLYVLYIISSRHESTYKILWLLAILAFPITGTILYLCFGNRKTLRPIRKRLEKGRATLTEATMATDVREELEEINCRVARTFCYVQELTGLPVMRCENAEYYPLGELAWQEMLESLKAAKRFIFVEYFIVEPGLMWDSMVEIMSEKAEQGVDVRVMYDDLGSISTYTKENVLQLRRKGIQCMAFNPLLFVTGTANYRDHRKMLIIDGNVAFSGGINLADEYINHVEKYGHWKDIGFRLTGAPVQNYTRMFAEFWNAFSDNPIAVNQFTGTTEASHLIGDGYVLSYYDSPIYPEPVSNNLYIELLTLATDTAWFFTPYLMLGDTLLDAFVRAARRGVDVRIIMPGIPDKALIYRMSRSYYSVLLQAGVKIYEYTPGFVHAKGCIIDDEIGTIGTVNLDYRSLFLHFENNSLFYKASLLADMKQDFLRTQQKCRERTMENIGHSFRKWLVDGVLQIFAPLC
ncbi:MAG: cardiolipin synthase [Lachnospiraceae bacterium]|nr:cardiolipin synthase [Lachnospiraceae bacterium]